MLLTVLRTYLKRYRSLLWAVVVLQGIQTMASLYLPRLNADIIDKGVARGDTGYIWRHGAWMLIISALASTAFAGGIVAPEVDGSFAVSAVGLAAGALQGLYEYFLKALRFCIVIPEVMYTRFGHPADATIEEIQA